MSEQDLFGDEKEPTVDPRPVEPTVASIPMPEPELVHPFVAEPVPAPVELPLDDRLREIAARLKIARDACAQIENEYKVASREYALASDKDIPLHLQNELAAQIDRAADRKRAELRERLAGLGISPTDLQLLK